MKICIDLSPAVHKRAGIGRFAQELSEALLKVDTYNQYWAFFNNSTSATVDPPLSHLPSLTLSLGNKLWRMSILFSHLAHIRQDSLFKEIDIFHSTDNLLPYFPHIGSVHTLLDLTFRRFPKTLTPLNRFYLSVMTPHFLRKADRIIAISEHSKKDAVDLYGTSPNKIKVIPLGVNKRFHVINDKEYLESVRQRYNLPNHYLLYVGTLEPRKNLVRLVEAFKHARLDDHILVVAGKTGWFSEAFFNKLRTLGLGERVLLTGFVSDADLPALYAGATAFLFPSIYEGFGLPVLEAMASGIPVICSNAASLPEVAGDAALLLSPYDINGWTEAMENVVHDHILHERLVDSGLQRSRLFSWEQTARLTLEVYRDIYANRH
jgi:glycosyltransferase involved in cell wall biosynthesis